jgi:hypothetical protein
MKGSPVGIETSTGTMEDIRSAALARLMEEERQERESLARAAAAAEAATQERERQLQEERIALRQRELEIRLMAEKAVLEEEAARIQAEREAALAAELERLRQRTPLERLQDEVKDLQAQLDSARRGFAEKVERELGSMMERLSLPSGPSDDALVAAWPMLLEWKDRDARINVYRSSWSNIERSIITNPHFTGNVAGSPEEFYQIPLVTKKHQDATDALKALEVRCVPHRASHEAAHNALAIAMTEFNAIENEYTAAANAHNSWGANETHWQGMKTTPSHMRHHTQLFQNMSYAEFQARRQVLIAKRTQLKETSDTAKATEAALKKLYDAENDAWAKNEERKELQTKISHLANLKSMCESSAPKALEVLNKAEAELESIEQTLRDQLSTEDIPTAFQRAVAIMRRRR